MQKNQSRYGGWESVNGPVSPGSDIQCDWTSTRIITVRMQQVYMFGVLAGKSNEIFLNIFFVLELFGIMSFAC